MSTSATPMMKQYDRLKSQYVDAILFFRLGDFYEMFKDDAQEVSRILNLTLTSRHGIPMCGIPYRAADSYIPRLLNAGKKIAICEQINTPVKGIAERAVVEVFTPGTIIDSSYLKNQDHNFIVSICQYHGNMSKLSVSIVDISTGEFIIYGEGVCSDILLKDIHTYNPQEILIQEKLSKNNVKFYNELCHSFKMVNSFPNLYYEGKNAWKTLCHILKVANLKAYRIECDSPELDSLNLLLEYVETNLFKKIRHISSLQVIRNNGFLIIDSNSQRNLEIFYNLNDRTESTTLFSTINKTKTAMGRRLLKKWLNQPLVDIAKIQYRQDLVRFFYGDQQLLHTCREIITSTLDIHRLVVRVSMEKAHPKDIMAIAVSIKCYIELYMLLHDSPFSELFKKDDISQLEKIVSYITRMLVDDPPVTIADGGIIREGFNAELDSFYRLEKDGNSMLTEYLEEEKKKSAIPNLRIKYNNLIGYFLEVSKGQLQKVPIYFEKRQSLVNADRFTTKKLGEVSNAIASAKENSIEIEKKLFLNLCERLQNYLSLLFTASNTLAYIDCVQGMSYQAILHNYVCPEMNENLCTHIIEGRHPVVETFSETSFIPNDLFLQKESFFALVTGPNMAGKSTFLRQNALIILLAHIGSFVPAKKACISVTDYIFCRLGASDNLARGESTFLVEMTETAHILRNATERSMVIMDEVGRGTSTTDGLAIAWAVSEYILTQIKCHTLFATHFHELSELNNEYLQMLSLKIKEEDDDIIFLRKIIKGHSKYSYGLHVAKLASIPELVIQRATEIIHDLKKESLGISQITQNPNSTVPQNTLKEQENPLREEYVTAIKKICSFDVNSHSPFEAMQFLYTIKEEISHIANI